MEATRSALSSKENWACRREQMEQFVTRFKLPRKAAPGQGRDVEAERGSERTFNDEPTSIALDWGPVGNLATRSPANVVDDQATRQRGRTGWWSYPRSDRGSRPKEKPLALHSHTPLMPGLGGKTCGRLESWRGGEVSARQVR